MMRTHTCGELRSEHVGQEVTLCGWVQTLRDKGALLWIDLRDRFGITQLTLEAENLAPELMQQARSFGREYVIQVTGTVKLRHSPSPKLETGAIEVVPSQLTLLNSAQLPPFLIEDETDGGDDLRMKFRYLDLRRKPVRENLILRHRVAQATRRYLDQQGFLEIETPVLIKSTPEGARDFVVPSRMNPGEFYALPQSPQTFKQLLMVSGFDKYFQIVKCFRDEDLRADRQPEFTQIDCEMSFVEQEDILNTFEGLIRSLFKEVKGIELPEKLQKMTYSEAMWSYGNDKPDIRFGMKLVNIKANQQLFAGVSLETFQVFDAAETVIAVSVPGASSWTRKQIDALTEWVKRPQIGMKGLAWMKREEEGSVKTSFDKFFSPEALAQLADFCEASNGSLTFFLAGDEKATRKAASELRLELGNQLGLRSKDQYSVHWVVDFPLLEQDEASGRWHAMHHPFTSPKKEDEEFLFTDPGKVRANAYDMVINGVEVGGGSIRIFDQALQAKMFERLGFSQEEAQKQFGFLMDAFTYGAPPHGGIAFGFDRLCALLGGSEIIRDFIAFPKNNSGRDVMIEAPSTIDALQLDELKLKTLA